MKQKRLFKPRRERHPVKWFVITLGLVMLSFASFSAGVQFASLTLDGPEFQMADTERPSGVDASMLEPLRVSHLPGRDT